MLLMSRLNHCCELVGRASAIITFVGLGSFAVVAAAIDVLR